MTVALADEIGQLSQFRCQTCEWFAGQSKEDQKAFVDHAKFCQKHGQKGWMAALYRLCEQHGLTTDVMLFRHHLHNHLDFEHVLR